jgi:hypothetical protein
MNLQAVLQEVLPEKHAFQGSEAYEKSNEEYFTVFESGIRPTAIAQPTTTQEVSALIEKLHPIFVAQEASLAIKGTGHTPFAGIQIHFLTNETTADSLHRCGQRTRWHDHRLARTERHTVG